MNKVEAIQSVKDICERYKQSHKHYPDSIQASGEIWRALVEPGYIFPPHAEPSVIVPLMDIGGTFSPELDPLVPISVVKVIPLSANPEKALRHDGTLRGRNTYTVKHMFGLEIPEVASIKIGHEETTDDEVWLSPEQALSLLGWLQQEEDTLLRIVEARTKGDE